MYFVYNNIVEKNRYNKFSVFFLSILVSLPPIGVYTYCVFTV